MKIKTITSKQKFLSGLNASRESLVARIHQAEQGPFYTLDEIKQKMKEWKVQKYGL